MPPPPAKSAKRAKKKRARELEVKEPETVAEDTPKKGKQNRWIKFYMEWRAAHPDVVASTKDVKELVKLARKDYVPLKKGFICAGCGLLNSLHSKSPNKKKITLFCAS